MKITVYGYGYVGKAVARFLEDHYELQLVDPAEFSGADLRSANDTGFVPTDYAVICVPTPMGADGSCDYSHVTAILKAARHTHYLVKSTIPPGTTEKLNFNASKGVTVCFSPEYIGEGNYEVQWWKDFAHPTDMKKHSFHIFGGVPSATTKWVDIWQKVAGWVPIYAQTNSRTAELVKYGENMFLASKKVIFTEFYKIAEAMGVDFHTFRQLLLLDARMGPAMTLVFPDKLAFGGKCLPKDTQALVNASVSYGHFPKLFQDVIDRNKDFAELDKS